MSFEIKVLSDVQELVFNELCCWCQIEMDGFIERFPMPVDTWSINRYREQWEDCLQNIVNGSSKGYLITAMRDPLLSTFISLYVLYRINDDVYIQNSILMCRDLDSKISKMSILDLLEDRETHADDGEPISEWKVTIDDVKMMLKKLKS